MFFFLKTYNSWPDQERPPESMSICVNVINQEKGSPEKKDPIKNIYKKANIVLAE